MDTFTAAKESTSRRQARGAPTREALLDAAEALAADHGFHVPSHRMIAGEARTHVALVNYHFSSKDMLFEAAIERRAGRLNDAWRTALRGLRSRKPLSVESILGAWWHPFATVEKESDPRWGSYLCVIARLSTAAQGEIWHQRHFGAVEREFLAILGEFLPNLEREDVEAGFRYARSLFGEVLLYRCGKLGCVARPPGFREDDLDRLVRFLGCGMRGLPATVAIAAD